jgi:hypothetical protein
MKPRTLLASVTLATAVAVGSAGVAWSAPSDTSTTVATQPAGGATTTAPDKAAKIAERCQKVPTVLDKLHGAETKLQARLTKLNEEKQTATDAGKTRRAERIQRRIDRVTKAIAKVDARTTKVTDWSAAHCQAA